MSNKGSLNSERHPYMRGYTTWQHNTFWRNERYSPKTKAYYEAWLEGNENIGKKFNTTDMTLQEAKDQVAQHHYGGMYQWNDLFPDIQSRLLDEVSDLYARSKWNEACEAQKKMIWDDLKIHVTTPKNVFGDVVSATRIVRATYEHAPNPEFKP